MTLGRIGRQLSELLRRQVDEAGIVVWYDPGRVYAGIIDTLDLGGTPLLRYEGSFFALRKALDPYLAEEDPEPVVIYVPKDQRETGHALVEAEAAGAVVFPGAPSLARNTRLPVVARAAAKASGHWTDKALEKLVRDIESGVLTSIEEIDRFIEGGDSKLRLLFQTADPQVVALRFLTDEQLDDEITAKKAQAELVDSLTRTFGLQVTAEVTPAELRTRLARFVLLTDFAAALGELPAALAGVDVAINSAEQEACVRLAREWRGRFDLRQTYRSAAHQVERQLGLAKLDLELPRETKAETFTFLESRLQESAARTLLAAPSYEVVDYTRARQSSYWSGTDADIQACWALIAVAGGVLVEADRVGQDVKRTGQDAAALLRGYTEGAEPWCNLDTAYRNFEQLLQTLDIELEADGVLEALVVRARERYSVVSAGLAETFVSALQNAAFRVPGIDRQAEVFLKHVRPHLGSAKVAYMLVDAFRYEMARELMLMQAVREDFEADLVPVLGTAPTITEVGMAALLPAAEDGLEIVPGSAGHVTVKVGGQDVTKREARLAYLAQKAGVPVASCLLEELLPQPNRSLRQQLAEAQLVVVTSQEIDSLCEGGNVSLARQVMGTLLERLVRGCRVLRNIGVEVIVLTADHGFLFGEEIGSDMKIEAPGGETVDLHARAWLGKGGSVEPGCLRAPLKALGTRADLDLCVPWGLGAFKVKGGANAYLHGGLSPQECVIPALCLKPRIKPQLTGGDIVWHLVPGSEKISTRFFSVQVKGESATLLEPVPPRVRVEIKMGRAGLSRMVSASYGFEAAVAEVQLRLAEPVPGKPRSLEPNTITLMITTGEAIRDRADVVLVDASTGLELARLKGIELALAM